MGFVRSKLKKRLRKKYHLAEFQELGFEINVSFKSDFSEDEFDLFLDDFIEEIEKNSLSVSGGGNFEKWEGFVISTIKFDSPTEKQRTDIEEWLKTRSNVKNVKLGELTDVWHGWD